MCIRDRNSDNYFKALVRYSADLSKLMNQHKVNVYQTSDAILAQQLKGWDKVIGDFNKKDPFFKKIVDSQKAYAKRVMKYLLMNQPNYKLAYENEFGSIGKVKITLHNKSSIEIIKLIQGSTMKIKNQLIQTNVEIKVQEGSSLEGSIKADKIVVEAEVKSNIGEVSKDAASAAGEFRIMGVSLNSVKAGLVSVGKTAKASFATMRAGIMSTGIGALVIAIGSLASFFTNTKRGADQLTQAFTAMGAVVDVLKDRLSQVGEAISFVFSGEFRKAGEALKGTFSGITEEIIKETKAMVALKKRTQ